MTNINCAIWRTGDCSTYDGYTLHLGGDEIDVYALAPDVVIAFRFSAGNTIAGSAHFRSLKAALDWSEEEFGVSGHNQMETIKQRDKLGLPI